MSTPNESPLGSEIPLDIARGDRGLSQHLKASMRLLADRSSDPEFKSMVGDVLEGRRSLRDLATSGAFERVLNPLVASFSDTFRGLSEDEREAMAEEGQRQLDGLGTAVQAADDDEEDDDNFGGGSILRTDW